MLCNAIRRSVLAGCALVAIGLATSLAHAQTAWPNRPVRIIVPYGPGGSTDVVARKIAQKLGEQTGQTFFVENKAGATGTIGASQVAKAEADGYTLLANDTTFSLLPHIFKNLPFDPAADLVPIGAFVFAPMGVAVSAESRFKTLPELLAEAKRQPNKLTYGTGGPGTTPHFATEALAIAAGVNFMHIPFKGSAEATQSILSGTIDFQIASTTALMSTLKGGKLRMLAISGDKRLPALPDVPTFKETGVNWLGVVNWVGLWAPSGVPADVLARLQKEIGTAMATADMKAFAEGVGAEPRYVDAETFARMLKESTDSWGKVAANAAFEKR